MENTAWRAPSGSFLNGEIPLLCKVYEKIGLVRSPNGAHSRKPVFQRGTPRSHGREALGVLT